jgi:hypothetical protein
MKVRNHFSAKIMEAVLTGLMQVRGGYGVLIPCGTH